MSHLPIDHAIRNVIRRPARSLMTLAATALVTGLLVASTAFVRSLDRSHKAAAPANTALLISTSSMRDILRSATSPAVADMIAADVAGVLKAGDVYASSPEIHMGTEIRVGDDPQSHQAFVRGVTERAYLVHEAVTLVEGRLPGPKEALVGRLAAAKSGLEASKLAPGQEVEIEGGRLKVSGIFAAPGSTLESEIWVDLGELQGLAQRDDCSTIFVRVEKPEDLAEVSLFANRRLDLELMSVDAQEYYRELSSYFEPIRVLVWAMAILIGIAALASGANTMMASVQDRIRELSILRAIGFRPSALMRTLFQEAFFLGASGALLGILVARLVVSHVSVRMAMTAFQLEIDAVCILAGMIGTLVLVVVGSLPALIRLGRMSVALALKAS